MLYASNLKIFEKFLDQTYDLGEDSFSIDHGQNYFNFFNRIGEPYYFLIQDKKSKLLIGTGCAILRDFGEFKMWYLCDLKIDPEHRGKNLTTSLFLAMGVKCTGITTEGYLISMDPGSAKVVHIFNKIAGIVNMPAKTKKLFIYSVDKQFVVENLFLFNKTLSKITFLSLAGIKDLVLTSTGKPMNLFHLQHGPFADDNSVDINELPSDAVIMFCTVENSLLYNELKITTDTTATIMFNGMDGFDWQWILTSEI